MILNFSILRERKGLTLVEILLVVVIIGVLAAMVIPNLAGRGEEARRSTARADIDANLSTALDMYELDNGRFPTTAQGLTALVTEPTETPVPKGWNGPYIKKKTVPKDPWGNDYVYVSPGAHNKEDYDLSSLGSDSVESEDDITNWEKTAEDE